MGLPFRRRALLPPSAIRLAIHGSIERDDQDSVHLLSRPAGGWRATMMRWRGKMILAVVAASLVALQVIYLRTHTMSPAVKRGNTKATTMETVTIDVGSCVYFTRRNYGGPFLCTRQHASEASASSASGSTGAGDDKSLLDPPEILRVVFDNATEHGPHGPDARIYYARDLTTDPPPPPESLPDCAGIGPIPSESNAINILYTEESSQYDKLLHNTKDMASFGIYLGFDPRPFTGFVFHNFGFAELVNRLDYPIAPPHQRLSASSKINSKGKGGLVVWAAGNCVSFSSRLAYLQRLHKIAPVHSLGKCWRTHIPTANESGGVFGGLDKGNPTQEWEYMGSTYKFWYAAENYLCDGYVTEKFWSPFAFGSVPILYGTSVHASYAPSDDSYLDVRNFTSPEDLGRFLLRLDQDDELYMQYHAWRKRPREEWNPNFVELLNRHHYGGQFNDGTTRSPEKAYVYEQQNGGRWECQVGAEVLRMKRMGVHNQVAAFPECTDPKGDTIPMPPKLSFLP